jgi:hypothetical protein
MSKNPISRLRTGSAATTSGLITALIVIALGNQGLQSWREARATDPNRWIADAFQPLTAAGWRINPASGPNATSHWLAPLVFDLVFIVLTALLAAAAAHNRGRLSLFFGVWGATALAGAGAGLASTPFAFAGVSAIPTANAYRDTLINGILLGFLVGVIAAVITTLLAGGPSAGKATATGVEAPPAGFNPDETWPLNE